MADEFEVTSAPLEEGGGNRTFVIAAVGLGALIVLSLICLGVYALVLQPRQRQATIERPTEIMLTNTAVALALTEAAAAQLASPTPPPTNTPPPTATTRPTNTAAPTPTPVIVLPTNTPTPTPFTTLPTVLPGTATAAAQLTLTAAAIAGGAGTPTRTPTALPTTGFADEAGLPGLAGLAAIFLAVIILSRRLRTRTAG